MKSKKIIRIEFIRCTIWLCFISIVGYLLIASVFSTCYIGSIEYLTDVYTRTVEVNTEHTFFVKDIYLLHVFTFLILSIWLMLKKKTDSRNWQHAKYIGIFICMAVVMVYIVLSGQYYPRADQRTVIELAAVIRNGDTSSFEMGGYLFKYPHQIGTVLYFQILSAIFGNLNFVAFELVNIIFILGTYAVLIKISNEIWKDPKKNVGKGTLFICLLFFPYVFYVFYLYGTVVGLFFALFSFYMLLLYVKIPRLWTLLLGSVGIMAAVIVKTNYQIFLIAEVLYLFLAGIFTIKEDRKKSFYHFVFAVMLIGCFTLGKAGINGYTKWISGECEKGIPMVTYIAMGLQEGKSAAGWYNSYNASVYEENNFDYDKTADEAKNEILRIISGYPDDISATISFFVMKVSSQWNNPTFQSLWLMDDREGKDGLRWLMEGKGRAVYIFLANLIQTWILEGAFLYGILRMKKGNLKETLLMMTFIGGFLFHLFWEAKAMYTIPFFLLLIPLCVCGFMEWSEWLVKRKELIIKDGFTSLTGKKIKKEIGVILIIIMVVCGLSNMDAFAKLFARNDDTAHFNTYTQEIVKQYE